MNGIGGSAWQQTPCRNQYGQDSFSTPVDQQLLSMLRSGTVDA